jgi:hypothetical protein
MCVATNSYVLSQWMTPRQAIGQVDPPEHADANPRVCDIVTCISEGRARHRSRTELRPVRK